VHRPHKEKIRFAFAVLLPGSNFLFRAEDIKITIDAAGNIIDLFSRNSISIYNICFTVFFFYTVAKRE
jgi:hypothetical protein